MINFLFYRKISFWAALFYCYYLRGAWNFKDPSAILQLQGPSAGLCLASSLSNFGGTVKLLDDCTDNFLTSTIAGNNQLSFTKGALVNSSGTLAISCGTLMPGPLGLSLLGNTIFTGNEMIDYPILVFGQENLMAGTPLFNYDITLANQEAMLALGIDSPLTCSIILNNGKLQLRKDTTLNGQVLLVGPGTIDLGGSLLSLPVSDIIWNTPLTFASSGNLEVNGCICLDSTWTFTTGTQQSATTNIYGYKTSKPCLNLTNHSAITVGPNYQLTFSGLRFDGFGRCAFSIDATSTIQFINCELDLGATCTITSGNLVITQAGCSIIAANADSLVLTGSATKLLIDGALLTCNVINNPGRLPIKTINEANLSIINGGDIVTATPLTSSLVLIPDYSENYEIFLNGNLEINQYKTVSITNPTPEVRIQAILNGNGNKLVFPTDAQVYLNLDPNIDLLIQNLIIEGFDPESFFFCGSPDTCGTITFAEGTILQASTDLVFNTNNRFFIQEEVTIDGNAKSLLLTNSTSFFLQDNAQLSIRNGNLVLASPYALTLSATTATLNLIDTTVNLLSGTFYFAASNLNIFGKTNFKALTPNNAATFAFTSVGNLCITSASVLNILDGMTFVYAPTSSDNQSSESLKKQLILQDSTSHLRISSSILDITARGIIFDAGNIDILGASQIMVSTTPGAALEIYDTAEINIAAGASLQINGPVMYL